MPLHLLGKKSWNVYNADNIARVRRDEAAAKAKEDAEEQRMQEIDAERRLAILRGEEPPPLPPTEAPEDEPRPRDRDAGPVGRERKKRKRAGEDDTEFELRVARERADAVHPSNEALRQSTSSAPIVDSTGHIDLFGEERKQGRHLKNEEAEKEAAKKKKELEDQYTMRFSNAAGRDGMIEVEMKQDIDQRVKGASETPTHDDEMKTGDQQNPVRGPDINYRGTKHIYN
ncbi:homocitrate synthase [Colletotrichum incanum]|nr:homocitrate synthase [Colletotrichum incanum]